LLRGADLFNAGYYWEAHEVWEVLWHAHGRHGVMADVIKALIKLAAAAVKVRERQEHGVRTHAGRAADLLASAMARGETHTLGLDLAFLLEQSRSAAANPPSDRGPAGAPVARVFAFDVQVDPDHAAG
jgi:predicted metal-dependent hydrolase